MVRNPLSVLSEVDVDKLTIKQLRAVITEAGLTHADCVEKAELRARARLALPSPATHVIWMQLKAGKSL